MLNEIKRFIKEDEALGTVEIVVLIAILVGVALLFKDRIMKLINSMFDKIDAGEIMDEAQKSSN